MARSRRRRFWNSPRKRRQPEPPRRKWSTFQQLEDRIVLSASPANLLPLDQFLVSVAESAPATSPADPAGEFAATIDFASYAAESELPDVTIVSEQLFSGIDALADALPGWTSVFDLSQSPAGSGGLSDFDLPLMTSDMATLFDLPNMVAGGLAGLPTFSTPSDYDDLLAQLQAGGFKLDTFSGTGNGSETTVLEVRKALGPIFLGAPPDGDAFSDTVPDILGGLGENIELTSDFMAIGAVFPEIVVGVDDQGFYVANETRVLLLAFASGSVQGTADVAGLVDVTVAGAGDALVGMDIGFAEGEPRLRIDALSADPGEVVVPEVRLGFADLELAATVDSLELNWDGRWRALSSTQETPYRFFNNITATLTLPELTGSDGQTPQALQLEGLRDGDSWTLVSAGESDNYLLHGFEISDLAVHVDISPGSYTGTGSALLTSDFGALEDPIAIGIDLSFDSQEFTATGSVDLGSQTVGSDAEILSFEQLLASFNFSADLIAGTADGGLAIAADSAVLLPSAGPEGTGPEADVPTGLATATGITGSLDSVGNLALAADSVVGGVPDIFDLSAGDFSLQLGPDVASGTPAAQLGEVQIDFTAFAGAPAVNITNVDIHADGSFALDTFSIGDATTTVSIAAPLPLVELVGFTLQGTGIVYRSRPASGQSRLSGLVTMLADRGKLLPSGVGPVEVDLDDVAGGLDLETAVVGFTASTLQVDLLDVLRVEATGVDVFIDPSAPDTPLATIAEADGSSPRFTSLPSVGLTNLELSAAGFSLGSFELVGGTANPINLSGFLDVDGLKLAAENLAYDPATGISGIVSIEAESATTVNTGPVSATISDDDPGDTTAAIAGTVDLATGAISLTARQLDASVNDILDVAASDVTLLLDPNALPDAEVLRIDDAAAHLTALDSLGLAPTATLSQFGLTQDGRFFIGGASVEMPAGYQNAIGVAGVLPYELRGVSLDFADPFALDAFTVTLSGEFDLAPLTTALPFTPTLEIDGTPVGGPLDVTLDVSSLSSGQIRPIDLGPITLGIADLTVPGTDVSLAGALQIGRLGPGGIPADLPGETSQVIGTLQVDGGSTIPAGVEITLAGDVAIAPDGAATLSAIGQFGVGAGGGPVAGNVSGTFEFAIAATPTPSAPLLDIAIDAALVDLVFSDIVIAIEPLLTLEVGEVEFIVDPPAGDPVATLRDAVLTFTSLPEDFGIPSIAIAALDGYDDNDDGLIDGFSVSTAIDLSDLSLGLGEQTLLVLEGLQLGVNGLEIRPEAGTGIRTGEIVFDAQGVQLLPGLLGGSEEETQTQTETFALPGIGSLDIETGAFALDFDVPASVSKSMTLSGFVPLSLTHVSASFDPSGGDVDASFALSGVPEPDTLVSLLGGAIGSPALSLVLEAYNDGTGAFEVIDPDNALTFGVAFVDGEFRLTDTPPVKANVDGLEVGLGGGLGDLTFGGYLALGGFDGLGLPAPMPAELGAPFSGQQVVGELSVTSSTDLGNVTGTLNLGGAFSSTAGVATIDLAGTASLAAELSYSGLSGSGNLAVDFNWPLVIDNSAGQPSILGIPTISSVQATELNLTVADLLQLDVASIEYADPGTLAPGDAIATLRDAVLTFTSLPADLGVPSITVAAIDGYDDNEDGLIDGFGVSASIDLSDVSLGLGEQTLLVLEGLQLVVYGLEIRPEAGTGIRTGEIVFDAQGVQLLPGLLGDGEEETQTQTETFALPGIGSLDIESGAFALDFDVPASVAKSMTLSGFVPLSLTHVSASFDPSGGDVDASFALSGVPEPDTLVSLLGGAIGSPGLSLVMEAYNDGSGAFEVIDPENALTFGVAFVDGEFRLTDTPPVKANVEGLEVGLAGGLGSLTFGGYLALGGFDGLGLPAPMPAELGAPFSGQQVVGELSVTSSTDLGNVTGTLNLGGAFSSTAGVATIDLAGTASLAAELSYSGLSGSGNLAVDFNWPLVIDNSAGQPSIAGVPAIDSVQATDLTLEAADVARFEITQIDYVSNPVAGAPVATASDVQVTLLGIFAGANVSASTDLDLYDDDGNGLIDGLALTNLTLAFADGQTWDYGPEGSPLLRVSDLSVTLSDLTFRPEAGGLSSGGSILLDLGLVEVYPDGGGAFATTVTNATGSIDPLTGKVTLSLGQLTIGLGPNSFFQVDVNSATFTLDDDDATDILTVASADLSLIDDVDTLSALSFGLTGFRFNLVNNQPRFGLDTVTLNSQAGVLTTLGLAGFVPFDLTDASLSFADDGQGYTDFTNFVLGVDGRFDLSLLESFLPFEPVLSVGANPADDGQGGANTFSFDLGIDVDEGIVQPLNVADITLGFREWAIGELVFAGEIIFGGYVDGQLVPTLGGSVGVDVNSAANKVQPSSGSGFDFHGAEIALDGSIDRTGGVTSIVVDADVQTNFDLQLGDFLSISDLGFNFGLDIDAPDNWLTDPLNLVSVTPRLESMSVGSLEASVGDFISLGAVPGSGGQPGLMIDFMPENDDPLAVFNFNVQSPLIGLSGTVENIALLQGGVPDFAAIDQITIELVSRGDGSASLLQEVFAEFLPLSISKISFDFQDGFFAYDGPSTGFEGITGIADPTALNLITSGRAGTPSWMPDDFLFEVGSDFTDLELDIPKLLAGEFPIVSLAGLGFEVGVDLGAFKIGGAISVGVVDADPGAGEAPVYYAAIEGGLEVGDYGATGALALTTAGPIGATLSVPLAIPLGQTGFLISGAAGTIQFATVALPDPQDIQSPSDLGTIPNPFDIELTDSAAIRNVIQGLWVDDPQGGFVLPTWTEPVTLALQGELTHVAVAGMISGTATVAANLTLPLGGQPVDPGLALLGFGDIKALGIPLVGATLLFDLRDELNPSLGFYIQAPAYGNPLGMLFPAQADFGVLLRTDGLAMATAVGLRALFTELADGALAQGQLFFELVAGKLLETIQNDPANSKLAGVLDPFLPLGQTVNDLDPAALVTLVRDALDLDDVLAALEAGGGQTVADIAPQLQAALASTLALSDALVSDLFSMAQRVIADGLDEALTTGEQLVALGLRNPGQENDPLDPFGLLTKLSPENLSIDRLVPVEFISEFTSLFVQTISQAIGAALQETAAFVASDSFDPRLLIEGSIQPTLLGVPVGEPPGGVQMSISKRGVSFGLDVSIARILELISTANMGPFSLLAYAAPDIQDETTIAYELPFNILDALQDLTSGGLPLGALNPFSPEWGELVISQIQAITHNYNVSILQFGPGSTLLENNTQIVDDFDDPVTPGKIPVTSQALLDRMRSLGGFLFTGGVLQSKLLSDPFEVIANIIEEAQQAGQELGDADGELAYLFQLFSTGPAFLEAVQDHLTQMEEFARAQAYLPISYATLLPQELQDLLDGDPAAFNEAFQTTFFDGDGNIREDAVISVLNALAAEIGDSASTIASNMFFEGVLNSKVLGIELANGRLFGGVLPDPDNPGQDVNFGNTALTVTGAIPWLGGLDVEMVLDSQLMPLPDPPVSGDDPLALLRAAFGDAIQLPRGRIEASLDTTTGPESSEFDMVLSSLGLDPSLFVLPTVGQAQASLRAYTPGFDLASSDPIQRVGGMEFIANLGLPGVVDNAEFTFRVGPPVVGPSTFIPFSAKASVDSITLAGFTISDAAFELISDASGISIGIQGEAKVLGAMFTVDGTLNSQMQGDLTLTLKTGETLAGAFGGFSGEGSFTLSLTGPTSGSIAFDGTLSGVPGVLGSLAVGGSIDSSGDFLFTSGVTSLALAGFSVQSASLTISNTSGVVDVEVDGSMSILGTSFAASGHLNSAGFGSLAMSLTGSTPSFGGLSGNGSFALNLSSPTSGSVTFNGTLSGVPGKGAALLSVSGNIQSNGNFYVDSSFTTLNLAGFQFSFIEVAVERVAGVTQVHLDSLLNTPLLGAPFSLSGSLSTAGQGSLDLNLASGTPAFSAFPVVSGSFSLQLASPTSGSVAFTGNISGVPGKGSASLSVAGTLSSSGNFSLSTSLSTNLALAGFSINGASLTIARSGFTTTVTVGGTNAISLLGATFRASGVLSTNGSGNLTLTNTLFTPSFGGLSASGTFSLNLSNDLSGSVSFSGNVSGVPGKSGSLSMSGSIQSNGNFSVSSSATSLSLAGFTINSTTVRVAKSGSTTRVYVEGNAQLNLLSTQFAINGDLSTSGNGTLSMSVAGGTPRFGGFQGTGSFNLVLSSSTSGSVSFSGSLINLPAGIQGSLGASGTVNSSGVFSLSASANNLIVSPSAAVFPLRAVVNGALSVSGNASNSSGQISGSGSIRVEQYFSSSNHPDVIPTFTMPSFSLNTSGTLTATLANFGFSAGIIDFDTDLVRLEINSGGLFRLNVDGPSVDVDDLFGTSGSLWHRDFSDFNIDLNVSADFNVQVFDGDNDLFMGGFILKGTDVRLVRSGGVLSLRLESDFNRQSRVKLIGNLGELDLNAFTISSNGTFDVDTTDLTIGSTTASTYVTADRVRFRKPTSSFFSLEMRVEDPTLHLPLNKTVDLGSVITFNENGSLTKDLFNQSTSLLNYGSGFAPLSDQTNNMDFRLQTTSSGWQFKKRDDGSYATQYIDLDLIGSTSFAELRSFSIDHNGNFSGSVRTQLKFSIGSTNYTFSTGTFSLSKVGNNVRLSVSNLNISLGFNSLNMSGYMQSNGSYSFSGSESVSATVSVVGYNLARIVGSFSASLSSSSGFSASISSASLQVWNPFSSSWNTIASGSASIDQQGKGTIGGIGFDW